MYKRVAALCAVFSFIIAVSACAAAAAEVGLYVAAADGGRTSGELPVMNTLSEEGFDVEKFPRLSLDNLLKYRAVIIPNTRTLARNEDPRWVDNLRAYVVEAGGALVFCHDAVGAERSPFGGVPLFPEIAMTGTVERQEASNVKVALDRTYFRDFDYLPGYESGETAEHMYYDRFMFAQAGGTAVLADPETGKTVVGTGEVGRGRVVLNGTYGGYRGRPAIRLEGIDRDVMVNTLRWALAGGGPVLSSPGEMEVAAWASERIKATSAVALVYGDGGAGAMNRHVVEENIRRAGISYDFIPVEFLAIRRLEKDDYPVAIIFLEPNTGDAEAEIVKSYLDSGGKAIIFLPQYSWRGGITGILEMFSCRPAGGYRNTFRPESGWGRFRGIVFEDPGHLPPVMEYIPRILQNILTVSDDARVLAYWRDMENQLRIPAVVRHEHGFLFNPNSFADHNFRIFIADAVVELLPGAGEEVCGNLMEIYRNRMEEAVSGVITREGQRYVRESRRLERMAAVACGRRDYRRANALLIQADENLVKAYAASMESVPDEVRLVFATWLTDPDDAAARFRDGGLTGLALHHAHGLYPSEIFEDEVVEDLLKEFVDVFHRNDLKIGVGWAPFRLHPGSEVHRRAREENWTIVPPGDYGKPRDPLPGDTGIISPCRSRREVTDHAVARAIEVARNYPVDYIFYDGIRWPSGGGGMRYCVCDYCREHFQKDTGIQVENWPDDVLSKHIDAFNDWRATHVTRIVRETREQVDKINPDVKIGVYTRTKGAASAEGQYWWEWGDYVDYVMPMIYTHDLETVKGRFMKVRGLLPEGKRARLVPCLNPVGQYSIGDPLAGLRQISLQRELAPAGIMYWPYSQLTGAYLELLSMGPFRSR